VDLVPYDKFKLTYINKVDKRRYEFYTHLHQFSPEKLTILLSLEKLRILQLTHAFKMKKLIGDLIKIMPFIGRKIADKGFYDINHIFAIALKYSNIDSYLQ